MKIREWGIPYQKQKNAGGDMRRRKKKRKNRIIERTVGVVFALCLFIMSVVNLIIPDRKMSQHADRMPSSRPHITVSSLISGDYMEQYDKYQSDQFVGKDLARWLKTAVSRLGGSRVENGVLIGKDGQLMEEIESPDQDALTKNLDAMNTFAGDNPDINMYMLLVPDAASVLEDKLPAFAGVADQPRMFSQVKRELENSYTWIDAAETLNKHAGEQIYYKTDQNWTSLGAFYVFGAAAESLGISTDAPSTFASYPVSTTFNGTLASKSGCRIGENEEIDIYVQKEKDNDVVVNYVDEQRKTTSLYDSSKLDTQDQYSVFLGGDFSVVDIRTVSESSRRLLLVKDSFANCFVQFLTPYFREIIVVDPRYYSGTVDDIMDTYRITDVLFLYSGNTFFKDNNISGMIESE